MLSYLVVGGSLKLRRNLIGPLSINPDRLYEALNKRIALISTKRLP